MKLQNDDRGVSEVIGAILVFGLLIALMAIIQTQAIPAANQQVEFDHNQEVQGDLTKFHERASRVAAHGTSESISVQAGTGYPNRMLFFNPPRATGTISTSETNTAKISGLEATDREVADYLNGSHTVEIDSRALEYGVNYNEFQNAPTTRYEYGILYEQYQNDTIVQNSGSVIDDTNINLVFMQGNYSQSSGGAQSVDIEPVSAPARPVTVTGEGGSDIVLTLPTELPVETWREYYQDQETVKNISDTGGTDEIEITLDGDQTYTLRMAGLGLEQGVDKPDAHYIVPADDGVSTIGAGDNATVAYEVRDKYNNPVNGINVTIQGETKQTDGEGRVTKRVSPGSPTTVTGQIEDCGSESRCRADFRVQVTDLNPNPSTGVTLEGASTDVTVISGLFGNDAGHSLEMKFSSSNGSAKMSRFRINHYHDEPNSMGDATLIDETDDSVSGIEIGGEFVDSDELEDIDPVEETGSVYALAFDDDVETNDYVVLTIVFDDGSRALYFVSPSGNNTL